MPHFKLFPTARKRAELLIDEIVLRKDEVGNTTHSVSVHSATELPDDVVGDARNIAGRLGYTLAEVEPEEETEDRQPVGDDVVGMSPVNVSGSDASQKEAAANQKQAGAQTGPSPTDQPTGTPSPSPGQTPSTSGGAPLPGSIQSSS